MGWQLVSVYAYVKDNSGSPPYPDQSLPWPQPHPDQSLPGYQPYPDQSLPGYQPYPDQSLPGFQPYPDQSLPGFQPYPDQSLPGPQPHPDQSLPGYQPYPDQSLPGNQPGLWPIRPPYVDIGFPGPQPGGPVYVDNTLPTIPGIRPRPPIYNPGPPSFDPDNMPEHPEVPDLNTGSWMWIQQPNSVETVAAFVMWRGPVVTHPDYDPQYPPEEAQPGQWVLTVAENRPAWAWIPTKPDSGDMPHPDRTLPGDLVK